jgi:hypothetical protein
MREAIGTLNVTQPSPRGRLELRQAILIRAGRTEPLGESAATTSPHDAVEPNALVAQLGDADSKRRGDRYPDLREPAAGDIKPIGTNSTFAVMRRCPSRPTAGC